MGGKVTEIRETVDKSVLQDIINIYGIESVLPKDTAKKAIFGVIPILLFLSTMKIVIEVFAPSPYLKMLILNYYWYFQSLYMLQLSSTLKMKAALLEKEAWGCFVTSVAGSKTSGPWDILGDLFDEIPEVERKKNPPPVQILLILHFLMPFF